MRSCPAGRAPGVLGCAATVAPLLDPTVPWSPREAHGWGENALVFSPHPEAAQCVGRTHPTREIVELLI